MAIAGEALDVLLASMMLTSGDYRTARIGSRRLLQSGAAGAAACGIALIITGTTGWGGLTDWPSHSL